MSTEIILDEKVVKYERFVNDKLKSDLETLMKQIDNIYSDIAEYLQIKDTIEKLNIFNIKTNRLNKNDNRLAIRTKVFQINNFSVYAKKINYDVFYNN
jgi:hypothetical protein